LNFLLEIVLNIAEQLLIGHYAIINQSYFKIQTRIIIQGSHYFQIRERSDFSFRELTGRSGRQQREVGRLLGEVNCD
jgi:hypothetical protein